jgi:hypothetical protein
LSYGFANAGEVAANTAPAVVTISIFFMMVSFDKWIRYHQDWQRSWFNPGSKTQIGESGFGPRAATGLAEERPRCHATMKGSRLPSPSGDAVLFEQALVKILDNASKDTAEESKICIEG